MHMPPLMNFRYNVFATAMEKKVRSVYVERE